MVIISDLAVGGKLTHLDGPLYGLSLGVYMLLGYLVARIYNLDEVLMLAHRWLALWLFLLLVVAEIYYHEIYRYHPVSYTHLDVYKRQGYDFDEGNTDWRSRVGIGSSSRPRIMFKP